MGRQDHSTVIVKNSGTAHKISKIWFGSDGSYYVTVPYHSANRAVLTMATLNYAAGPMHQIPVADLLEIAALDEERVKLSHHPDGFCQFSGAGVLSGRDECGNPKGIGVFARDLMHVAPGPTFAIVFHGLMDFTKTEDVGTNDIVFDADRVIAEPECTGFRIEGYYLRPQFRRFVEVADDQSRWISLIHPSSAILRLRVILAPIDCLIPGLIGLHLSAVGADSSPSGFAITGPGGNLRDNTRGENVGDMISAIYPPPEGLCTRRNMNYPPRTADSTNAR